MPSDTLVELPGIARRGVVGRAFEWLLRVSGLGRLRRRHPANCPAFTSALVALAAKMAKADGVVVKVEQDAFESFLEVPAGEIKNVRRLFNLAMQDTAGFEAYADRIARDLTGQPELERNVLECLIYVACADGVLHPAEDQFLHTVALRFGLSEEAWRQLRATFVEDPGSPYTVLGLSPGASDSQLRKRYKQLVAQNHPDKLLAAGAPAAVIKAATAKLAHINVAYETIRREKAKLAEAS